VEVRLKLLELSIGKTAELERVGTHRNRVSSIKATSQSSSKNHTGGRHTSDLETARASRSEAEGSAIERLAAHVVVVLRDRVERVDVAALVDAAAVDEAAEDAAEVARTMVRAMRALIENCILNGVLMRWFLEGEEGVVKS
jgi:hypothetical protein